MGLTDRLKDLKGKAEDAVAEHSEQIRGAVEKTATAADQRTGGRYHERIQQAGAKAEGLVRSVGGTGEQGTAAQAQEPSAEGAEGAEAADGAPGAADDTV